MEKKIFVLFVFLLFISGCNTQNSIPSEDIQDPIPSEEDCVVSGFYCIYENIPESMKYNNHSDEIPDEFKLEQSFLQDYFTPININYQNYPIGFEYPSPVFYCKNTEEEPKILEYFELVCEEYIEGCLHERKAVICDDIYFIEDVTSSWGPKIYGPFDNPFMSI